MRIVYRDPEHVADRLTLFTVEHLGESARVWAQGAARLDREQVQETLLKRSAVVARIDGAIAGTPFYAALVPGYMNYLWQEGRMVLRLAALRGRDPTSLRTSAEVLALRGVHPTPEVAEAELRKVGETRLPASPTARRPLRLWIDSVRALLVFGGFMDAKKAEGKRDHRLGIRELAALAAVGVVWAMTWVFPVTFMILMSWTCERHTRRIFDSTLTLYGGSVEARSGRRKRRRGLRASVTAALFALSIAVPIGFLVYVIHEHPAALTPLKGVAALVAGSLVIATIGLGSRR